MISRTPADVLLAVLPFVVGCGDVSTSKLSPEREQRYAEEGVVRRAADLDFRFTTDPGGRGERWEDRRASIVVTGRSLLIHKNDKIGLEITPRTQKDVAVQRAGQRVRIRSGRGRTEEVWSFEPPSDAPGWTNDIRTVLKGVTAGKR